MITKKIIDRYHVNYENKKFVNFYKTSNEGHKIYFPQCFRKFKVLFKKIFSPQIVKKTFDVKSISDFSRSKEVQNDVFLNIFGN